MSIAIVLSKLVLALGPKMIGAPVLSDCLISLDCRLLSSELIGTHHVLIGEVQNLKTQPGLPLLYGNRGYVS